jgi:8-oxo-dGTP diphosphatase
MSTAYLIRHAHAGDRHKWLGDDHARPVSDKGAREIKAVTKALAKAKVGRLFSSPAKRCIQTLEPTGEKLGLEVEVRKELREGADPTRLIELMEKFVDDTPAFSGHGDVIPEVIHLLVRRGMEIEEPVGNTKGSWWEIHHDGKRFTHAVWHPAA